MKPVFQCTRCGQCCEGKGGIVVNSLEQQHLAQFLGLSVQEFLDSYAISRAEKKLLRAQELESSSTGFACIFYLPGTGCAVHEVRPDVCRAWPYFRGNLVDKNSFRMAKQDCPGIDMESSHDDFVLQGYEYLQAHALFRQGENCANALRLCIDDLPEKIRILLRNTV